MRQACAPQRYDGPDDVCTGSDGFLRRVRQVRSNSKRRMDTIIRRADPGVVYLTGCLCAGVDSSSPPMVVHPARRAGQQLWRRENEQVHRQSRCPRRRPWHSCLAHRSLLPTSRTRNCWSISMQQSRACSRPDLQHCCPRSKSRRMLTRECRYPTRHASCGSPSSVGLIESVWNQRRKSDELGARRPRPVGRECSRWRIPSGHIARKHRRFKRRSSPRLYGSMEEMSRTSGRPGQRMSACSHAASANVMLAMPSFQLLPLRLLDCVAKANPAGRKNRLI